MASFCKKTLTYAHETQMRLNRRNEDRFQYGEIHSQTGRYP